MSKNTSNSPLKLDPWSASSLLQKAIRRGDTDLAQRAASLFYRYRGTAIFRRLLHIAIEDVGIANIALVSEIATLVTDKPLRDILGSDIELIHDTCGKLASSPKDRSADYLDSIVRWANLAPSTYERETGVGRLVSNAAQLLRQCTIDRNNQSTISEAAVHQLLDKDWTARNPSLENIIVRAAKCRAYPFTLMLMPLWSVLAAENLEVSAATQSLPEPEWLDGVPLFVFDKHTAIGKAAISRLASENPDMRRMLSRWVAAPHRIQVAEIAAFYADAMPVSRKFRWSRSEILEELGCQADMVLAGCDIDGVQCVLEAARDNLENLNDVRRRCYRGTNE